MSGNVQVFYIFFSAAMLSLAIPNEFLKFGSPIIGLFALVPLYLVFKQFKSYKNAFALTALHTLLVHLLSSFWLAFFKDFAALTLGASAAGTAIIGGAIGWMLYLPLSTAGAQLGERNRYTALPFRAIWFAAVYTFYEWIKSIGWLGYPWGTLSQSMFLWRTFIQIADIAGTYGITFLTALFAAVVAERTAFSARPFAKARRLLPESYKKTLAAVCVLFFAALSYGLFRQLEGRQPIKYLNAVMVQQNSDPWLQRDDTDAILLSQRLTENALSECRKAGMPVDLVVWSEGCLRYAFPMNESHYYYFPESRPLLPFIRDTGIPFLLGGPYTPDNASGRVFNAALLFDRDGRFRGAYGKNHLVPFAEAVPFAAFPAVRAFFKKVIHISAGWAPGDQYALFDIPAQLPENRTLPPVKVVSLAQSADEQERAESAQEYVRIAAPICFDDAFPDVCTPLVKNGAELLMNLTDDSWSRLESAETQHFVIAAFRAIELRTTLARSTNAGLTAALDPTGRIIGSMPMFTEGALSLSVPVYAHQDTVYMRWGNWFPKLCFLLIVVCALRIARRKADAAVPSERKKILRIQKKIKKKAARP